MKVKDLRKYIKTNNVTLIPQDISGLDFMPEYAANANIFDMKLSDYASLPLADFDKLDPEEFTEDEFEEIQDMIRMLLMMNKYKYNGLYETMSYDYNAIFNTEWTETQLHGEQKTTDEIGKRKETATFGEHANDTTTTIGERKTTDVVAQRVDTNNIAEVTETDTIADRTNTDTIAAREHNENAYTDSTAHVSNGYNSSTGTPDGTDTTNAGARKSTDAGYTDSHTNGGGVDTHKTSAHLDTITHGGGTDTHTTDETTDVVTNTSYEHADTKESDKATDTHTSQTYTDTISRAGNIGVMSTQDLIGQQRSVVDFSFWEIIYADIIAKIALFIY